MSDRFLCPILRCDWHYDRPIPAPTDALASVFGVGTLAATSAYQQAHETERVLSDHLAEHKLADFVRTISEERQKTVAWLVSIRSALEPAPGAPPWTPEALRNVDQALRWFQGVMFGPPWSEGHSTGKLPIAGGE